MNRNLMLAAVMAAALLSPVGADATLINTSHSNIRHQGITVIPTDSASMKECTDAGGTVATKDGKTTCTIPEPTPK